jgi:hypothetical protein
MPRAKKSPSEAKPSEKKPEFAAAPAMGSPAPEQNQRAASAAAPVPPMTVGKTTEQSGKPVSSVNPQGSNAGVKSNGKGQTDLDTAIRARAYEIWERRGRPEGAGHDDWLQAEREILSEHSKRTA